MANSAFTPQNNIVGIADGSTAGLVSTVAQTFSGNKTFSGAITASGGFSGNVQVAAPANYWATSSIYTVAGIGQLDHTGNNELTLSANGYRNSSGFWTSYQAGSQSGAAQLALTNTGDIKFRTAGFYGFSSDSPNPPDVGSVNSSGQWVFGPASGLGLGHTIQAGTSSTTALCTFRNSSAADVRINMGSASGAGTGSFNNDSASAAGFDWRQGGTNILGSVDSTGIWILGKSISGVTHKINGALEIASDTALTTGGWISSARGTVANAATTSISNATSGYNGLLIVTTSEGYTAQFALGGTLNTVSEISDPSSTFSATAGTANSVNIYYTSPNYRIQNNRSSSTITIMFLGGPGRIHL